MKILVLNSGSSSLKFLLLNMTNNETLVKGNIERIGISNSTMTYKKNDEKFVVNENLPSHKQAIKLLFDTLVHPKHGVISSLNEIAGFGHRYVNGGPDINSSVVVTEQIANKLAEYVDLAPVHAPANLAGIKVCMELAPNIPSVVVFDTAFHSKMPEYAFRYAIPKQDYLDYKIRRYGFHGTSHYFVTQKYAQTVGKKPEDVKIITCHLGNGSSISAVEGGHSVDTSMGFTPLEGLIMGTRSGDLDPAVVNFLAIKKNMTVAEVVDYLNKKSGLLGLTGFTSDMRDLEENLDNPDCQLALDMLNYRLKKYIGAYFAALGGAEAIVFTGGIGENDDLVRAGSLKGLEVLGIKLDAKLNAERLRGKIRKISTPDSPVAVYIIPTDEELVIAQETLDLVKK